MNIQGASTLIMLGVAAVLWFLYFAPSLAQRRDALVERAASEGRRLTAAEAAQLRVTRASRTRGIASFVLIAAIIVIGAQTWLAIAVGTVTGTWVVFGAAAAVALLSLVLLVRLSRDADEPVAVRAPRTGEFDMALDAPAAAADAEQRRSWTPVPIPPLRYAASPVATAQAAPAIDHAALLRAAAAESERALRGAEQQPEVARIRPAAPEAAPAASKWARMGVVTDADREFTDIDAVLARRRRA